jgi:hypothetical protein
MAVRSSDGSPGPACTTMNSSPNSSCKLLSSRSEFDPDQATFKPVKSFEPRPTARGSAPSRLKCFPLIIGSTTMDEPTRQMQKVRCCGDFGVPEFGQINTAQQAIQHAVPSDGRLERPIYLHGRYLDRQGPLQSSFVPLVARLQP